MNVPSKSRLPKRTSILIGHALRADIHGHLVKVDHLFSPNLSSEYDLQVYGSKIFDNALSIEAWDQKDLVGLVAIYVNGPNAYVTHVGINPGWERQGIAQRLMNRAFVEARDRKYEALGLHVRQLNTGAIALYTKLGMSERSREAGKVFMEINI